ncbi:nitroreductase family protein [Desulfococcaceae bacterium HSG9]|nr:nitroreductase family protein [Desulfococcaceae bacterium HSG9]
MSDLLKIIKERRSVRKYTDQEITEESLNTILEAARWSPSWSNTQCWEVVVVKDAAIRKLLQETIGPKNPATKAIVAAPVLLALCGKLGTSGFYQDKVTTKFGDWFMYDLGIVNQTLCLSAQTLGIGTVIVGLFDHNKAAEILKIPAGYEVVTLIPMGYPQKTLSATKRREVNEFIHVDTF